MKKLPVFLISLMTVVSSGAVCRASIIPPQGPGQIGYSSVVLCDSLSAHQDPGFSSPSVQTLHYGDRIIVMDTKDGWAQAALSDDVDGVPVWVKEEYVAVDPAYYQTEGETVVYAWNDTGAKQVALLDGGTSLPILRDDGDWIVVSLRGAAGWINNPVRSGSPAQNTPRNASGDDEEEGSQDNDSIEDSGESGDTAFTVYARDGSTALIHPTGGAMYEDGEGRTYVKDDQDGYYYCISNDVTYAFDPTMWTGEAYGENEFPEDVE